MVGASRLELLTSASQTRRATNCAKPRMDTLYHIFLKRCIIELMEKTEKPKYTEAELRRMLAMDRAAVEEKLAKNKAAGRKLGGIIAIAIAIVAMIVILTMIAINSHR